MRRPRALALACLLVLTGCVPSLHPLIDDDIAVFEPGLIGTWAESDDDWTYRRMAEGPGDKPAVQFERAGDHGYLATWYDEGRGARFQALAGRVGNALYVDFTPADRASDHDFLALHFVPCHTFWKATMDGDKLKLVPMDSDWVKARVKAGRLEIPYEIVDDAVVLTASTARLRRFVIRHEAEAFPEQKPTAPPFGSAEARRAAPRPRWR